MLPILNPPLSSLPIASLWVVPVHQPQASSIVHQTWTGDSFHTWYYTCFNAILPNLPTLSLSLSHRVHKTDLYISVSFAVSYTGLLLPSLLFKLTCLYTQKCFLIVGFPGGSDGKESACNAGDHVQSLGWEDFLEKEMATHSNILSWRIPWTEEPGRLHSTWLQRVGHDWVTVTHSLTHCCSMVWKLLNCWHKLQPIFCESFGWV